MRNANVRKRPSGIVRFLNILIIATALAAVIFGQIPSAMQLLGGALILGGLVWYSRMEGEAA